MNRHTLLCILSIIPTLLTFHSCSDEGPLIERFAITSISPPPGAVAVDKARWVLMTFSKPVSFTEVEKIQMKYADSGEKIRYSVFLLGGPPREVSEHWPLDATPWKPGSTVEVSIPADLADQDGRILGQTARFFFSVAPDSVPFAVASTRPVLNDTVTLDASGTISGVLDFTDYVEVPDSALTISPPVELHILRLAIVAKRTATPRLSSLLTKECAFILVDAQAGTRYALTVSASVHDYEGETLASDYHLVFYTKQ